MKCRLCGSGKLKLYYTQGNQDQFKYYKCLKCSLVNLDMSGGIDQGKYSTKYYDPNDMSLKQNRDKLATYKFIMRNTHDQGKYLDIGCGNGKLLQLARNDGWDVHGLELSEFFANEIKAHLNIHIEVANFLEYQGNEKYDLITLRHVLEHLPDPIIAMKSINSLLKPDTKAVLEFPNIEGLSFKFKRFLNKLGLAKKPYSNNYKPGHCHEFSKKSFNELLKRTGFKVLRWETYSSKPIVDLIYRNIPIGGKVRVIIKKAS